MANDKIKTKHSTPKISPSLERRSERDRQVLNKTVAGIQSQTGEKGLYTLRAILSVVKKAAREVENAHVYSEIKELFLKTAENVAAVVEKNDPYTGRHIKRVVEYSLAIARHMREPLRDLEDLVMAAVLHDIGKIGIKDSVLFKRGGLDHEEIAHMRDHPRVGEDILGHIDQMKKVRKTMRAHHEQWNGNGYPDGLRGEAIPVHARIISIADTFDALTNDRPYRKAAGYKTALREIKRCSGEEYDPEIVEAFMRACEAGDIIIMNRS